MLTRGVEACRCPLRIAVDDLVETDIVHGIACGVSLEMPSGM
jgi:hypothetical protein